MSRDMSIRLGSVALGPVEIYALMQAAEFIPQRFMTADFLRRILNVKEVTTEKVSLVKFASWQHLCLGAILCFSEKGPNFLGVIPGNGKTEMTSVLLLNAMSIADSTSQANAQKYRIFSEMKHPELALALVGASVIAVRAGFVQEVKVAWCCVMLCKDAMNWLFTRQLAASRHVAMDAVTESTASLCSNLRMFNTTLLAVSAWKGKRVGLIGGLVLSTAGVLKSGAEMERLTNVPFKKALGVGLANAVILFWAVKDAGAF